MLRLTIPAFELYDNVNNEFLNFKEQHLVLEHSLVSISKWEAKWNKPFISKDKKTKEETLSYIKCMTITQNVNDLVFNQIQINSSLMNKINRYIEAPMTATWFNDNNKPSRPNNEQITSELIYYWMISFNIPFEAQKWHLNRLLTLIRVCNIKNKPAKKQSRNEILSKNAALNKARREKFGTSG